MVTSRSFAGDTWRRFRRSPGALAGAVIVALILALAVFAPVVAPHDPLGAVLAQQSRPPSLAHPLGTDKLGRDVFSRIVYGARTSIAIGFVAVGLAITLGTLIGSIAGYAGGATENALMGAMDVMLAFPS
ncbi:MAG: hypothetical protein ABSH03_17575, partial [Candidatus Lustribacter sp.]